MQTEAFPDTMPNVVHMRQRALDLIGTTSDTHLSLRETMTVGRICFDELGPFSELLTYVSQDLDEQRLPRFVVLSGWLAPWGLTSTYPAAVLRIASYLMGDNPDEEQIVDWDRLKRDFPHADFER